MEHMENILRDFATNVCFWAAFFSWITAQLTKMLSHLISAKRIDLKYLVSTGGMPSAHSATVCGLTTAIGWTCGFGSPHFAISITLAILTMFDASTVRRAAGQQAAILNEMMEELFEGRFSEKKLKELLGHTRLEVFGGLIVGILVALHICSYFEIYGN